jgi:hypothetical protein
MRKTMKLEVNKRPLHLNDLKLGHLYQNENKSLIIMPISDNLHCYLVFDDSEKFPLVLNVYELIGLQLEVKTAIYHQIHKATITFKDENCNRFQLLNYEEANCSYNLYQIENITTRHIHNFIPIESEVTLPSFLIVSTNSDKPLIIPKDKLKDYVQKELGILAETPFIRSKTLTIQIEL